MSIRRSGVFLEDVLVAILVVAVLAWLLWGYFSSANHHRHETRFEKIFSVSSAVQSDEEKACVQALVDQKLEELKLAYEKAAIQEVTPENIEIQLEAIRSFYRACKEAEYFEYEVKYDLLELPAAPSG